MCRLNFSSARILLAHDALVEFADAGAHQRRQTQQARHARAVSGLRKNSAGTSGRSPQSPSETTRFLPVCLALYKRLSARRIRSLWACSPFGIMVAVPTLTVSHSPVVECA